ncbi:hypothetical protein N787_10000 [Arenimonas metalli CF5-1]|uniref:Uncharacterized protein n=1 Tax=Arenimonas metalli CF5-1 TaxID=1384056 RepID=A0A091B4U6_9GAMM|nr:hypothetical protein N787_10000 [Arenimonas metalli CF5-1]
MLLALGGCGGADDAAGGDANVANAPMDEGTEAAAGADTPAAEDNGLPPPLALAPAHLDALVRGITAENAQLERAVRELEAADGDTETLAALMGIGIESLDDHGTAASGLDARDYPFLRNALYEHLDQLDTRNALQAHYRDIDTTGLDEATAAEARRVAAEVLAATPDPYADLDPALADALRQREGELTALRDANARLLMKVAES